MNYAENTLKNFFSCLLLDAPALWIHCLRSFFHVICLMTGLIYSFIQPEFLNSEVWVSIYILSGLILTLDSFAFIVRKKELWPYVYFFDALFVFSLIYVTGYAFFAFLFLVWLLQTAFAGMQFHFKGALLQGLWISCLLTWVVLLSPHFAGGEMLSFSINSTILFITAGISGLVGYYFKTFNLLSRFKFWRSFKNLFHNNIKNSDPLRNNILHNIEEFQSSVAQIKKIIHAQDVHAVNNKWMIELKDEVEDLDEKFKNFDSNIHLKK